MKKFTEMTDIGFKRTITKMQKKDALLREAAKTLRCNPDQIVERVQILLSEIEEKKAQLKELKDKSK